MTSLALLLVFPLVWPFIAKAIWKHEITLAEMGINLAIGVLVVTAGWAAGRYAQGKDVEIWNGQVTGKYSKQVSCEHDYKCRCVTKKDSNGKPYEDCDTCYDHPYDVDWHLQTTIGDIEVERVNRQGTKEPPRYTQAQNGDPVAQDKSYMNYIKAAPDSLFNTLADQRLKDEYAGKLPAYPSDVYNLHYVDRVLAAGMALPENGLWNHELALALRTLGPAKQVNVVIVFTKDANPQYANALHAAWLGGKKNDVVVVMGTPNYPEIAWTRVLSWTDKEVFKVQLRDALLDQKTVDRTRVLQTISSYVVKDFQRKPMADFAYLASQVEPPMWVLVGLFVLSVLASVGLSLYLSQNEYSSGGFGLSRRFRYR